MLRKLDWSRRIIKAVALISMVVFGLGNAASVAAADSITITQPTENQSYASETNLLVEGAFIGNHAHVQLGHYEDTDGDGQVDDFVVDHTSVALGHSGYGNGYSYRFTLPAVPTGTSVPYYVKAMTHNQNHQQTAYKVIKIYIYTSGPGG